METRGDSDVVLGDYDALGCVLDNLIKNAIEAIGREGHIPARLSEAEETVRVELEDDGPGISEGIDVFALFTTTKKSGSGIGLANVQQMVSAHGGSIRHRPGTPAGTVSVMDLPRR